MNQTVICCASGRWVRLVKATLLLLFLHGCASQPLPPVFTGVPHRAPVVSYTKETQVTDFIDDGQMCKPLSAGASGAGMLALEDAAYPDLWERVRAGYSLAGDVDERRIDGQMNIYANRQKLFDVVGPRASWYLYYVVQELEQRNMPLELALLPFVESGYNPSAVSPSQAAGLWQIVPRTGTHLGLNQNGWYDGRKDVVASTDAALDYLEELHKQFDGDWYLALAAYNAGEGSVQRAIDRNRRLGKATDYWSLPLSQQACNYVPRLLALSRVLDDPEDHGVELAPIPNQPSFVPVKVSQQISLQQAASLTGMDSADLFDLNPGYKNGYTQPNGSAMLLVPTAEHTNFMAALEDMPSQGSAAGGQRYRVRSGDSLGTIARAHHTTPAQTHVSRPPESSDHYAVRQGDSLWSIGKRFGLSTTQLARMNNLSATATLHVGQLLSVQASAAPSRVSVAPDTLHAGKRKIDYTVKSGDSLYRIAGRFNVKVVEVMRWNAIAANRPLIRPGQSLILYVDASLST